MKALIGYTEACEMLNLSKATLKRYVMLGAIPSYKFNRRRLFDPEELRGWVEKQKSPEPPVAFKFRWLQELGKWMAKTQEIFEDPERLKSLSFREQLALAEQISRFMNRSTRFLLEMREAALGTMDRANTRRKREGHLASIMFSEKDEKLPGNALNAEDRANTRRKREGHLASIMFSEKDEKLPGSSIDRSGIK